MGEDAISSFVCLKPVEVVVVTSVRGKGGEKKACATASWSTGLKSVTQN